MLQKSLYFTICVSIFATQVWSDEPTPGQKAIKQRVSPKLLREAMALQEYHNRSTEAAPTSLDDMQRVSEKLKKNGDSNEADLVQKFIQEHQKLVARHAAGASGKLVVHVKVYELNLSELSPEHMVHNKAVGDPVEIQLELDQLVADKKAKIFIDPLLVESKMSVPVRCFADGEFLLATQSEIPTLVELRECGATIEVTPTILTKNRVRLHTCCEIFEKTLGNRPFLQDTNAADGTRKKNQSSRELTFGEAAIHTYQCDKTGRGLVVVMEVTPRN